MHVQYVALCEQVVIAADGKPSLINVFNDLQAPQFPITLPRLVFVARIHFTREEAGGARQIEVAITDPNGVELARPSGDVHGCSIYTLSLCRDEQVNRMEMTPVSGSGA